MSNVVDNMPNAEYHSMTDYASKSMLDLINKSPAHLKWRLDNPQNIETKAMRRGSLIHKLVLEPDDFESEYVLSPTDAPKRPSIAQINAKKPSDATLKAIDYWDAFNHKAAGKIVLDAAEFQEAQDISVAVRANPVALEILENATAFEQSIFTEDFETGIKTKVRTDIGIGDRIYDLKTTKNANVRSFAASIRSYRYDVQAAFYMDQRNNAGIQTNMFGFIAVDTVDKPYQCTVFHSLTEEAIEQGRAEYTANLKLYAECLESNEWPGYPESYDLISPAGHAWDIEEYDPDESND